MRRVICFFSLLILLTSCPHKEKYIKDIEKISCSNFEISPIAFFFESHNGVAFCNIGIRIKSTGNENNKIDFQKWRLENCCKLISVGKVFNERDNKKEIFEFDFSPNQKEDFGLFFEDSLLNFKELLKLHLKVNGTDTFYTYHKR